MNIINTLWVLAEQHNLLLSECKTSIVYLVSLKCLGMKSVLSMMFLFINVVLAQRDEGKNAKILIFENVHGIGGEYNFKFETSDGTSREEIGKIEKYPDGTESQVVKGSYSYVGDNDVIYTVNYIADQNGYRLMKLAPFEIAPEAFAAVPQGLDPAVVGSLLGRVR